MPSLAFKIALPLNSKALSSKILTCVPHSLDVAFICSDCSFFESLRSADPVFIVSLSLSMIDCLFFVASASSFSFRTASASALLWFRCAGTTFLRMILLLSSKEESKPARIPISASPASPVAAIAFSAETTAPLYLSEKNYATLRPALASHCID